MKPLSKKQKAVLAQLAARAYKSLVAVGCPLDDQTAWRKEQQQEVTGKESMMEMTQQDYVPLTRHFLSLAAGRNVYIDDNTYNDMDKAIHRLQDMMERHVALDELRVSHFTRSIHSTRSKLHPVSIVRLTPLSILPS